MQRHTHTQNAVPGATTTPERVIHARLNKLPLRLDKSLGTSRGKKLRRRGSHRGVVSPRENEMCYPTDPAGKTRRIHKFVAARCRRCRT